MSKKLEDKDYRDHLREQIYFLQSSAKLYNLGTEIEAKRMATHMRVLLYDTRDSSSLLGQMRLKKKMKFISTAQKYDPTNLLSQQCLLSMTVGPDGGFSILCLKIITNINLCPAENGVTRLSFAIYTEKYIVEKT